jgi:hypothetical protein
MGGYVTAELELAREVVKQLQPGWLCLGICLPGLSLQWACSRSLYEGGWGLQRIVVRAEIELKSCC